MAADVRDADLRGIGRRCTLPRRVKRFAERGFRLSRMRCIRVFSLLLLLLAYGKLVKRRRCGRTVMLRENGSLSK